MALNSRLSNSLKSIERDSYQYERSPYSFVTPAALIYQVTDRIKSLATPKLRKDTTIREGFSRYISNPTYSGVSKTAIRAQCSSRLGELALPLKRHKSFTYELPIPRPVSHTALRYEATERTHELAMPRKRYSAR